MNKLGMAAMPDLVLKFKHKKCVFGDCVQEIGNCDTVRYGTAVCKFFKIIDIQKDLTAISEMDSSKIISFSSVLLLPSAAFCPVLTMDVNATLLL